MPAHKVFKQRVRTRMAKTGESYTSARAQLLRKATASEPTAHAVTPEAVPPDAATAEPAAPDAPDLPTSDAAMLRASGRTYGEWFELLDAWGGAEHRHTDIARWLVSEHGVDGWWSQSITVGYERARGLRAVHEMPGGFAVGANRTIHAGDEQVLAAFSNAAIRARWLPDVELRQRRTTAARVARFDWPDPPSRLVVAATPKGEDRTTVSIQHEKLPDAESAARLKAAWRDRLAALKGFLERDGDDAG